MADAVSMDLLVDQYKASLSGPVNTLQTTKTNLNSRLSALADLKSKLSTLSTTVRSFALSGTNSPFLKYTVDSSSATAVTATATSLAAAGSHSLKVTQLASNDTLLAARLTAAAESGFAASTPYSFSLSMADGTSRSVNVQLTATTNGDALTAIAAAVNGDSVLKDKVTASVVKISATESRLVFTAKGSGASKAITGVGGDFQGLLGTGSVDFTGRTASTATTAGFVKAGPALEGLNAKFTLDGIDMSRETNAVNDAVAGVTFSLKAPQLATDAPVTLQVAIDKDALVKSVQQFITEYNAVISFVQTKTAIDAANKTRGVLAADSSARLLRSSLRAIAGSVVGGVTAGNPQALADVGITVSRDGTLVLSNTATLESAITTDIRKVSELFSNSAGNGIAQQMKTSLDGLTGSGGSLETTSAGIRTQMTAIGDRIKKLNAQIDKKAEAYRDQFAQIQVLIARTQAQQNMLNMFLG